MDEKKNVPESPDKSRKSASDSVRSTNTITDGNDELHQISSEEVQSGKNDFQPPIFKKIDSEEFSDQYDTRKLFLGIQRHLFLILSCIVFFGLIGVLTTYKFLKTYQAEAIVIYQEEKSISRDIPGGFILTNLSMPTVMDMIKLPKHFEAVKSILGLELEPAGLAGMIDIPTPKNKSNLIRIVAKGSSPNLVVDIVNAIARVAVKTSQEFTREQLSMALENYRTQQEVTRLTLSKQIQEIEDFKTTHQYFEMDPTYSTILAEAGNFRKNLSSAELNYQKILVEYENLKREAERLPDLVPITRESKESPLRMRVISLETELAKARAKYTRENPKIMLIEEELKELLTKSKSIKPENSDDEYYERNDIKAKLMLELMHMQGKVRSAQKTKEDFP